MLKKCTMCLKKVPFQKESLLIIRCILLGWNDQECTMFLFSPQQQSTQRRTLLTSRMDLAKLKTANVLVMSFPSLQFFDVLFFYRPVLKLSDDDSGTLRPDKSSGPAIRGSPSAKISVRSSLSSRFYL